MSLLHIISTPVTTLHGKHFTRHFTLCSWHAFFPPGTPCGWQGLRFDRTAGPLWLVSLESAANTEREGPRLPVEITARTGARRCVVASIT